MFQWIGLTLKYLQILRYYYYYNQENMMNNLSELCWYQEKFSILPLRFWDMFQLSCLVFHCFPSLCQLSWLRYFIVLFSCFRKLLVWFLKQATILYFHNLSNSSFDTQAHYFKPYILWSWKKNHKFIKDQLPTENFKVMRFV